MSIERDSVLINRYRIVEILAQGGMGSIYRAVDENLGVEVAVKENLFTSEEYARQFRREAVILANLRHPNLPRVTDHFVIDGQGQYLVMDFIEGEDLRQRIDREGLLSDADAVVLGLAVCDALSYLHSQHPQIVHRDIKPGNVKITSDGSIVLVDFGLAKVTQGSQVTTTGARAMTPGYSPPEQYGTARTDHRTDIYSLGATLYMVLTGELPADALVRAMGQADLTPLRTLNPKVSRRLANVIERAMALRPDDRYQSADEFKQALINSRVITARRGKPESTLTPAPAGAVDVVAEGNQNAHNEVQLVQNATSGYESKNLVLPRSRTGCWIIGTFFVVSLVVVLTGAYLLKPELVEQAVSWLPDNVGSIPLPAWLKSPAQTVTPTISPTVHSLPAEVAISTSLMTPPPSSPTPEDELIISISSTASEPTVVPQPTPTFTPSPTPIGGGAGQIAYASDVTGLPQIWIMNSDGTAPHQVYDMPEGACQPAWSPDGERLAFISPCAGNQEIYPGAALFIIHVDGTDLVSLPSMPGGDFDPKWSPDGSEIVFTSLRDFNRAQVYKVNLADNTVISLSANTVRDSQPELSPDGRKIAFVTTRRGPYQIWIMLEDGTDAILLSRSGSLKNTHPVWSPDGQVILYTQTELLGGVPRLVAMRVEEGNLIESRVIEEVIPMREASYSPDGAWIAFESWPEGSNHDIFIMTPNGLGRQRLTDDEAFDFDPAWRP